MGEQPPLTFDADGIPLAASCISGDPRAPFFWLKSIGDFDIFLDGALVTDVVSYDRVAGWIVQLVRGSTTPERQERRGGVTVVRR